MEYRQLGSSGLRVSAIGLGGNPFGRDVDEAQAGRVINHALDLGVNFLDTADVYALGVSEQYVGKAVAGRRPEALIATKVGKTRTVGERTMGDAVNNRGLSRKHVIEGVEASLRRLNTEYIDLYQLHEPDATAPIEETLRALDDLVRAGKVRYLGCSNFAPWQICEALWAADRRNLAPLVASQSRYNVLDRAIEHDLLPCCRRFGIGVITYAPLSAGILTGKYRTGETPPTDTRIGRNPRQQRQLTPERLGQASRLDALAREYGRTPSQLALAWLLARPEVSTVIAGATRPEQVEENVQAVGWTLGPDDLRRVDAAIGVGASAVGHGAAA